MRVIKAPPPDLTTLLVLLGSSTLVLVEGADDRHILNEWYPEGTYDILYHDAGGSADVQILLQQVLIQTSHAYGIIDRDFQTDADVESRLSDLNQPLLTLRRYSIENYLLEPKAIQEELGNYYGRTSLVPDTEEVEQELLQCCRNLLTAMAANWLFLEAGGITFFKKGHDVRDRQSLVEQSASKLGCDAFVAEQRITAKENLLAPMLASLESAQGYINGKHLLHQLYVTYGIQGTHHDYFLNSLVSAVKRLGLHEDIQEIMERRILA